MEFGKVSSPEHLNRIDWQLPADDTVTRQWLNAQALRGYAQYFIGAPAWGHKEWVGQIYPAGAPSRSYLHHYAKIFNTIELNTTHYRIPTAEQAKRWRDLVPPTFQFCPKIFQGISHSISGLSDLALLTEWFLFLDALGENRGPCFLQLPPHFDYSMKHHLFHFLQKWPDKFELALEFRHANWFENGKLLPALVRYLQSKNVASVITDVAGRRDVLHTSLSSSFTMIRFIGNDLHPSDEVRAQLWSRRLADWTQKGLSRIYFFVHQPDDLQMPTMAQKIIRLFNQAEDRAVFNEFEFVREPEQLTIMD